MSDTIDADKAEMDEMEAALAAAGDMPSEDAVAPTAAENGAAATEGGMTKYEAGLRKTMDANLDKYRAALDKKFNERKAKLEAGVQSKLDLKAVSAGQLAADPDVAKKQVRKQIKTSTDRIAALLAQLQKIDPQAAAEALAAIKIEPAAPAEAPAETPAA